MQQFRIKEGEVNKIEGQNKADLLLHSLHSAFTPLDVLLFVAFIHKRMVNIIWHF